MSPKRANLDWREVPPFHWGPSPKNKKKLVKKKIDVSASRGSLVVRTPRVPWAGRRTTPKGGTAKKIMCLLRNCSSISIYFRSFLFFLIGSNLITAANFCLNGKFAVVGTYDGRCIFYETEVRPVSLCILESRTRKSTLYSRFPLRKIYPHFVFVTKS